jgi:hypothetical protein
LPQNTWQRLKITKNTDKLKNITFFSEFENYFQNLSFPENTFVEKFYRHKNKCNFTHNFYCNCSRNLSRSGNMPGRGGGGAGSSYELDAAQSIQNKIFFHILDLAGIFLLKA